MRDDASEQDHSPPPSRGEDGPDESARPIAVSLKDPPASAPASRRLRGLSPWGLCLAAIGLCSVVAINVILISGGVSSSAAQAPSAPGNASGGATATSPAALAQSARDPDEDEEVRGAELAPAAEPVPSAEPEPSPSAEPGPHKPKAPERVRTVQQAAAKSCSTSSVDGLSRQIIRQSRCIDPNAFVAMPELPNLVTNSHVFLYLDRSARDQLVKVLNSHREQTMTIHSALRTVAQQYLLRRWATSKRCGIQIATPPGESNHETGLALDIGEAPKWRSALESHGFAWLGAIDRVHFDYKGSGASSHSSVDVMAFQQLWNRNHPDDTIPANGRYTPATEQRLKSAPAGGFPIGASCEKAPAGGPSRAPAPRPDE